MHAARGHMKCLMHTRSFTIGGALLLATLGCRDDTTAPTESAPTTPQAIVAAAAALAFWQVSAGQFHACGVTTDNETYCWGLNSSGQLGVGTNTGPEGCANGIGTTSPCSTRPVLVAGGHRFRQLSAGANHTCAVTPDYRAYCWGSGGIGDGTVESFTPVAVAGGHLFRQVEAGQYFTCGVTYPDNKAYCWGANRDGQLGDGTLTSRLRPVLVVGGYQFRQVSAGNYHTCGVTTTNRAFCWGLNHDGQLGDSSTAYHHTKPSRVAGARQFRQVDAGGYHSCGVTTTNRAYCWGSGEYGQLGNGKTYRSFWPRAVAGGLYIRRVSTGLFHTCGETTTDRAYCWGGNSYGQLGDGSPQFTKRLTPVAVAGGLYFKQVSAGFWLTCGKTSASLGYCWGSNWHGELGDGNGGYGVVSLTPVPVLGPL